MIATSHIAATEGRYSERSGAREERDRAVIEKRLLDVDTPERVEKRLVRLSTAGAIPEPETVVEARSAEVVVLERLIGTNDLIGVGFLARGAAAARAVARVVIRSRPDLIDGFGTGFLVAPGLLMTNNHVLSDAASAVHSLAEFDHHLGPDGALGPSVGFGLDPQRFFVTDEALDFTVVAVAPSAGGRSLAEFGWNPLIEAEGKVIVRELLNIVQHPNGEPKQLALRENRLVDLVEDFLHYQTDTAPGSSGSPVFNDQWEVVGLHHSGVPRRDGQGRILARGGAPWTPAMGEGAIDWMANEGVRVSRICRRLRGLGLPGPQAALRDQILAAPAPPATPELAAVAAAPPPGTGELSGLATTLTVPIEITVRVGAVAPPPQAPVPAIATRAPEDGHDVAEALVRLTEARRAPYFDEAADAEARRAYYAGLEAGASGQELFEALGQLLSATHRTTPRYRPHLELYPDVDLQPDGQLRSIYTGEKFSPERLIVEDGRTELRRLQARELRLAEAATDPAGSEALEAELEALLPYNCEHVVPQSWFAKKEPMRGDLHHLFTCQMQCNSFRGNTPYFDFTDFGEVVRERCGKREEHRFEPNAGKGEAARATFYFLVRYPGLINANVTELEEDRLAVLLAWHDAFPVTAYEQHRNARIHARQGNRNPFIDNPDWASKTALALALG